MGYISKHHKFNVGDECFFCSGDGERVYRDVVVKIAIDIQSNGTQISYQTGRGSTYREDEIYDTANEAFRAWDNDHPSAEPLPEPPELIVVEP